MDQQDIKELLEAMLMKKNKDGNKYPGPDGSVCRWKRQVMRKLGSKKEHNHLLVNRLNKDLRNVKEFIIAKETPTEDKDKNKDKEKDTKKNYIYSQDVDTGVATPKKKIFESNTASEAKKLLTKVKDSPGKYKQHSVVRNPRYLTKHQREEMDIALWDALLDYIDEERYDHLWTHLKRGNVLELWKILDGRAASEPEEYCTALKDRIKTKNFDDNDIKTTEHFGRWFSDTVELYKQLTNSARNSGQVKLIHLYSENEFVKDIINKIGDHLMSIKDDYIRDCRNGKKWDLERLRNRIQYMQIKGELKDERDERFHASSLKTMANAVDDGSNHDYDNDIHNGRHQIKRDGQPRDDARRHSRFANDKKEDAREIIRRAQERERTKKQDKDEDRDKEHDDNRRRNEKRKYDTPYEKRWCSTCYHNGEQEWRCKTHNAVDCSKYKTIKTDAHENYTDGELKRAKEIIAMDTTARANRSHARIRSSREQHQLLPLDTEHGMGNSDDEEKQEQKPWHELGFR